MVVIFVDTDQHFFVSLDKFNLWVRNISKYILHSFLFYFLWYSGKEFNNQANYFIICLWLLLSFSLLSLSLHGHMLKTVT